MSENFYQVEGDLSRFEASPSGIVVHTNESLLCRDCAFRLRPVGSCEKYPERKPGKVLKGEPSCPFYEKDDRLKPWEEDDEPDEDDEPGTED